MVPAFFAWQEVGVAHLIFFVVVACCVAWMWRTRPSSEPKKPIFAVILGISTGNPGFRVSREQAFRHAANALESTSPVAGVLERIYNNSRIDTRYFCVPDLAGPLDSAVGEGDVVTANDDLGSGADGAVASPDNFYPPDGSFMVNTDRRFQRFRECALPLATGVAKRAMREVGVGPSDVGKIVLVTSTGGGGPGFGGELVKAIGLNHAVEREIVSFQGCGAGINGLRLASQYAVTHPGRLALLVSVELPSLHMHKEDSVNAAILHAIFGDGCAVAVVKGLTARTARPGSLAVLDNRSWLVDGTEDGIKMMFGDNGVSCKLSKRLPDYVKTNVSDFVDEMLGAHSVDKGDVDFWALHPGGHRIVEETRKSLHLSLEETKGCWGVLRDHGNMVSATVLFVLERALKEHRKLREGGGLGFQHVVALSFSPGVTVEGLLLRALPMSPTAHSYHQE